jgi:hypothetical protein
MMKIDAETIPMKKQRYITVGDYFESPKNEWHFRISQMKDWRFEFLVLLHELIEWALCKYRGITEPDIKKFDEMFEAERLQGKHTDDEEPGEDKRAPYRKQHLFAEKIERMVAIALRVNWKKYSNEVMSLYENFYE